MRCGDYIELALMVFVIGVIRCCNVGGITVVKALVFLLLISFIVGVQSDVYGQFDEGFPIVVRVDLDKDGKFENEKAVIDLIAADDPKKEGYGVYKQYTHKTGKKINCRGMKYPYATLTMNKAWEGVILKQVNRMKDY